jgi:hypothetical protein
MLLRNYFGHGLRLLHIPRPLLAAAISSKRYETILSPKELQEQWW